MKYKIIEDLTSDVMFEVYGKDMAELFTNAAEALFSVICQLDVIKPTETNTIKISADSPKELLFSWLQELLVTAEINELFYSQFKITKITETQLEAFAYGESITPEKGETVVKAITNYKFDLTKTDKGFTARVSLDI